MTQVSKTHELERGFSLPWKAPILPKAKKAFLALAMFLAIETFAESDSLHQTPRHLADLLVVTERSTIRGFRYLRNPDDFEL